MKETVEHFSPWGNVSKLQFLRYACLFKCLSLELHSMMLMECFWSFIAFDLVNYAWLDTLKLAIQNDFAHIPDLIVNNVVDVLIWFQLQCEVWNASFDLPLISWKMMRNWVCYAGLNMSPKPGCCAHFWTVQRLKMMWWRFLIGPFEFLAYLNYLFYLTFCLILFSDQNTFKNHKKIIICQ